MPGHEFRQAQTALISHYIDQENNFSPLYETPLVGKPWISILLEVPIYEWSVVGLSRMTDWPLVVAARWVSLSSFYLLLPALYLLLGMVGVSQQRRLLTLALILCCPVYIFYSRAFLIESMELMCCAWFLFGYVMMMARRRWTWFMLATVAGTGAALIKSATFAVWLVPAAAYSAWQLWHGVRQRVGVSAFFQTLFWGFAGVVVPLGALRLWIELTDPLKETHKTAWIFTSKNLSLGNWGLDNLSARFSPGTWSILTQRWSEAIMSPWLIGVGLVAGLVAFPAQRGRIAGMAGVFFAAQLLFPFAYAYQEYYFYACALFLLGGLGFVLHGLLDSRLPRWISWSLLLVLPLAQLQTYWRVYRPYQLVEATGDISLTAALRKLTPRDSVIVVSGADWGAMIPYYSQRRALMILDGSINNQDYLERVFTDLWDEDVGALVLLHGQRSNTMLRDLAVAHFGLDATPTFSHPIGDIYCSRRYSASIRRALKEPGNPPELIVGTPEEDTVIANALTRVNSGLARTQLSAISPAPIRAHFAYGLGSFGYGSETVLSAHPDSEVWVRAPAKAKQIEWSFGMVYEAWGRGGDKTNGVDFTIIGLRPGQGERVIYKRELDPVRRVADRGRQREFIPYEPLPGEILHFKTGSRGSYAFDWTYWASINVK